MADENPISDAARETAEQMKKLLEDGWQTVSLIMVRRLPISPANPDGALEMQVFNTAPHPLALELEAARMMIANVIQASEKAATEAAAREAEPQGKGRIHLM
jgi:hypothetical protein